jgi:hypothetical protein
LAIVKSSASWNNIAAGNERIFIRLARREILTAPSAQSNKKNTIKTKYSWPEGGGIAFIQNYRKRRRQGLNSGNDCSSFLIKPAKPTR